MRARGFAVSTVVYILAGVFLVALAGGLIHSYNEGQKAKAELETCKEKNRELNGIVADQNASIKMHEDAAAKAKARSKAMQAEAEKQLAAVRSERDRLAALRGKPTSCEDAVREVRKGLK